jgi:hypothetical protein
MVDLTAIAAFLFVGAYTARLLRETVGDLINLARLLRRITVTIVWRNDTN